MPLLAEIERGLHGLPMVAHTTPRLRKLNIWCDGATARRGRKLVGRATWDNPVQHVPRIEAFIPETELSEHLWQPVFFLARNSAESARNVYRSRGP